MGFIEIDLFYIAKLT